MQVDKHVVKMIVETAQLLSTTHRILDGDENFVLSDDRHDILYKVTHRNHPSAVWTRTSVENYNWLVDHFQYLLEEYTHRYKKVHKCASMLYTLSSPPLNLKDWDWTCPPLCMPEEFIRDTLVESYRAYYKTAKSHIHKWTNREPPLWLTYERA